MPILSKPVTPLKNVNNVLQIDKNLLLAHSSVVASAYFSDVANWNQIFVFYRSTSGRQDQLIAFDATQGTPQANFLVSTKGRDVFEVQKIIIRDFDNGELIIPRSGLVAGDFDINMNIPVSFSWSNIISGVSTSGGGELSRTGGGGWSNLAYSAALTGDFTLSCVIQTAASENLIFGYSKQVPGSFTSDPATQVSSSMYSDIGIIHHYAGNTGTPSSSVNGTNVTGNPGLHTLEIKRIGSSITAKADGTTVFTDTYSSPIYPTAMLYSGGNIVSVTLS